MTDTPRTDAFLKGQESWRDSHWVTFSRQLERERAAAIRELRAVQGEPVESQRLAYLYTKQMKVFIAPLMTYADWLAAIDAAIDAARG